MNDACLCPLMDSGDLSRVNSLPSCLFVCLEAYFTVKIRSSPASQVCLCISSHLPVGTKIGLLKKGTRLKIIGNTLLDLRDDRL